MTRLSFFVALSQCLTLAPAFAYDTEWMARVVEKQPCLESVGSVVASPKKCWSWTRHETASPFYDAQMDRILVGGTDGVLHIVDSAGNTTNRIPLEGNAVSAIVRSGENNLVFATDRGVIYAIDSVTLTTKWSTEVEEGVLESPYVFGEKVYVVSQLGTLYCVALSSGKIEWVKKRQLPNRIFLRHFSTPVMVVSDVKTSERQLLVLGNPDGQLEFLDPEDGSIVESISVGPNQEGFKDVATTPVFDGKSIYAASANYGVVSINANTRVKKWTFEEAGITELQLSSGVLVGSGAKVVVGVNAQTGEMLWKYRFKSGASGPVSVIKGEVFVGSDIDRLFILDLFTGKETQAPVGSGLGFASRVENYDGSLLAMSSAGVLFKFRQNDRILNVGKKAQR